MTPKRANRNPTTGDTDPLDDATDAVLLASRALVGVAARSLAEAGSTLTLQQYRGLVLIGSRIRQNVSGLAEALDIHPSTATRLCDRLHEKGLIERTPSAESRREVTLRLSDEGRAIVRAVTLHRRRDIRQILATMEPAELRRLVSAFERFADAAGEIPDSAGRLGWTA